MARPRAIVPDPDAWTVAYYEQTLLAALRMPGSKRTTWHAALISAVARLTDTSARRELYVWMEAAIGRSDVSIQSWCKATGRSRTSFDRRRREALEPIVAALNENGVPLRNPIEKASTPEDCGAGAN